MSLFMPFSICATYLTLSTGYRTSGHWAPAEVPSRVGPVDKSKNSAETHRFSGRTLELEIEKDGIYHPLKV